MYLRPPENVDVLRLPYSFFGRDRTTSANNTVKYCEVQIDVRPNIQKHLQNIDFVQLTVFLCVDFTVQVWYNIVSSAKS